MSDEPISFIALDPARNPLLDISLAPGASTTALWVMGAIACALLLWAAISDMFFGRIIPDWVSGTIAVAGAAAAPFASGSPISHYIAALALALLFGLGAWKGAVGMGDVKLYVALGLLLGWGGIWVVVVTHILALVIGGVVMLIIRRKVPVPMAPFIFLAFLVYLAGAGAPLAAVGVALALGLVAFGLMFMRERRTPTPQFPELISSLLGDAPRARAGLGLAVRIDADGEVTAVKPAPRQSMIEASLIGHLSHEDITALDRDGHLTVPLDGVTARIYLAGPRAWLEAERS